MKKILRWKYGWRQLCQTLSKYSQHNMTQHNMTTHNNVIHVNNLPFSHDFCPFIETKSRIPSNEKYKPIGETSKTGLYRFVLKMTYTTKVICGPLLKNYEPNPINLASYSDTENKYILYFRTRNEPSKQLTSMSRITSNNFITRKTQP